jgi:hypothetical protein
MAPVATESDSGELCIGPGGKEPCLYKKVHSRIPSCMESKLCDGSGKACMTVWVLEVYKQREHVRVAGIYNGKVISEFMDLNRTEQEELMDAGLYIEHFGMEWE